MKFRASISLCILGGVPLCDSGQAATAEASNNPYSYIAATNVFRLKPPAESTPPEKLPTPPPPIITLQGITTIFGYCEVLFKVTAPASGAQAAKAEFFVLREGQREGAVEVVSINVLSSTATFRNHGVQQVVALGK